MNANQQTKLNQYLLSLLLLAFLSLGSISPVAAKNRTSSILDVKLHSEGLLVGQLFSNSGTPLVGTEVTLSMVNGMGAKAITNEQGGFAFSGVSGAVHLSSDQVSRTVRVWQHDAAPPNAAPAVLLVQQDELTRGQHHSPLANNIVKRTKRLMANPLIVAGIVGTAVAIPVAIHNNDDDPAS